MMMQTRVNKYKTYRRFIKHMDAPKNRQDITESSLTEVFKEKQMMPPWLWFGLLTSAIVLSVLVIIFFVLGDM
jgi:hypothetical protein